MNQRYFGPVTAKFVSHKSHIGNSCRNINNFNPAGYTSMCQDVLAGRKTEVEMFSLHLMGLAKKHGIPVPVNETLYLELRAIEALQ